jgi:hypothetical protein
VVLAPKGELIGVEPRDPVAPRWVLLKAEFENPVWLIVDVPFMELCTVLLPSRELAKVELCDAEAPK